MELIETWNKHYQKFLDSQLLRPGNYPEIMHHNTVTENAVVLVHGLTDSPFFMKAIGKKFHEMGFNVLIPLLPGHGLRKPEERMMQVTLEEWQKEVDFAVNCARVIGRKISIGGLSTGGTLSTYKVITNPDTITGGLFLFSAALDIGDLKEIILRLDDLVKTVSFVEQKKRKRQVLLRSVIEAIKKEQPELSNDRQMARLLGSVIDTIRRESYESDTIIWGIGDHPYRYAEMSYNGAAQLSKLIQAIEHHYAQKIEKYSDIQHPVFAAHSEMDTTAGIKEIELLIDNHPQTNDKTKLFRIQKRLNVRHASVVLEQAIAAEGEILESPNPIFDDMMRHIKEFSRKHL